ncbi:uncharacterized protein F5Z01DRAFT_674133 [Emericellopsis atlantica]|uniref:Zn(2)-C6 fungal-type domain-containing protein n=1 Tax=Emericellopsis atlantica TaxID=2614577 RepID=A0A9P8CR57_9HYPO|nr:uncharacterized protein F5Z01DRAFT_674133 [Emericellopsis atlantica]KAG9254386.1 hypothetical protein F5Z01DRAFT_674133 [Emericellopsis atlantica]
MDLDSDSASHSRLQPPSASSVKTTQRVLACVLCQQRKIKCDRKFPCSNCSKNQAHCVPATQSRRRKRRFPERELLERLRSYEDLLRQNKIQFEPLHRNLGTPNVKGPPHSNDASDDDRPDTKTSASPQSTTKPETLFEARRAMRHSKQNDDGSETDEVTEQMHDDIVQKTWDSLGDEHILFGSRQESVDLSSVHPEPAHVFRLWQVYLDNVDPMLKVTHTPTLQSRIIEAIGSIRGIQPMLEALMFGIYCIALTTLSPQDCEATFGTSKDTLSTRFRFGCQQALLNCRFLHSSELECLTAFYLYLHSLAKTCDPRSLSSMLGIATRTAMRIGIHSELSNSRCPVLHAELRRRLWYSLIFFDARISELAMYKNTCLTPTWDCKTPLNVNDHDLRVDMREPPVAQTKTSEALFVVVRSEIANFVRHASFYLDFTTPALKAVAREVADEKQVADFAKSMERDYFDHCDPGNPLHHLSIWSTRSFLFRSFLQEHYAECASGAKITAQQASDALSHAIHMIECDTQLHNTTLVKGFRWFFRYQFPALGYFHIIEALKKRPTGPVAKRAWDIMSDNYEARHAVSDNTDINGPFVKHFIKLILQLWDLTQATAQRGGQHNPEPRIVQIMSSKAAELGLSWGQREETGTGEFGDTMSTYMDEFIWSMSAGYPPQDCISGLGPLGLIDGMGSSLQEQVQNPIDAGLQMPSSGPWMAGRYW